MPSPAFLPRILRRREASFALQGGGAHGAFTWGVLDRLLEAGIGPDGITGTSAGTINALALADGWLRDRHDGARERLAAVWEANAAAFPSWMVTGPDEAPILTTSAKTALGLAGRMSPYQLNPFNHDPLRSLLTKHIDFERLAAAPAPRLFIAATKVRTGQVRFFTNRDLTVEAALASACLPAMSKAVEIDGEAYWDGGYSANPGLSPLVLGTGLSPDVVVVLIVPLSFDGLPNTKAQIEGREAEFAFTTAFRREAQVLQEMTTAAGRSALPGRLERRLRGMRWHLVDGAQVLEELDPLTRITAYGPFLEYLRDEGREVANEWLAISGRQLGKASSVPLSRIVGI